MAIISNFELLAKPIAPAVGPALEVGRVVVQGYFLEISNLESRDVILIFRTRTSVKQVDDSDNTEFTNSNNVVVYDITQDNIFQTTMNSAGETILGKQLGHSVVCITLPAGQTGSLAILPNVQNLLTIPGAPPPDLAIRGYTELLQASTIDSFSPLTFSSPDSARVLVSAEHRGTFIDPKFDPSDSNVQNDLDFDQLSYSLQTANGKALQVLNTHAPCNDPFQDLVTSDFPGIGSNNSVSSISLSELSSTLFKGANSAARTTVFKLGKLPVSIEYSIKNGKYVIKEKGVKDALKLFKRRKRISAKSLPNSKDLVKKINAALSGNLKAGKEIEKILSKLV